LAQAFLETGLAEPTPDDLESFWPAVLHEYGHLQPRCDE